MIKVIKGTATEIEVAAIEAALTLRQVEHEQAYEYGKPILRGAIEVSDGVSR